VVEMGAVHGKEPAPCGPGVLAGSRSRRLAVVMGINVVVAIAEVAGGLWGHSVALLADAGHNAADVAAAALALVAIRLSRRPPTRAKSFGYHRSGALAAQVNAAAVLAVSVLVAAASVARLAHPPAVQGEVVVATASVALVLNGVAALVLVSRAGRDLNMRAVLLHMGGDAMASAGVALAGVALTVDPSLRWLDPATGLVVAVLIGWQALQMGRQVADVLLEGTPADTDTAALESAVRDLAGVDDLHDLHVWSLSSEMTMLSAHLVMSGHPSLEEAQHVAGEVRAMLAGDFGIAHSTLELECETCREAPAGPCAMGPAAPPQLTGSRRDHHS